MRVLRSRGAELEREFAFGVVRQLFEPALAEASEPERADLLQASGGAAALLGLPGAPAASGGPSTGIDPSFAILHGLYWLCANLAAAGPLCLVVDDAHWADGPSLRYLAFLLTRLEELDVALVLATRPREAGTDAELLATVTTDPSAEVIRLATADKSRGRPARGGGTRRISRSGFRRGVPARDARYAVSAARARGGPREGGIAPTAQAARARRENRCANDRTLDPPSARSAARTRRAARPRARSSRAQRPVRRPRNSQVWTTPRRRSGRAVDGGRDPRAGPAADVQSTRSSAAASTTQIPSGERARGHRRAAQLLAEQPGADERVAEHLLVSEPAADGWVVGAADRGRAAPPGSTERPESEALLLRRALSRAGAARMRPGLLLDLGMAEASAGLAELGRAPAAGSRRRGRRGRRRSGDGARARAQSRAALCRRRSRCSIAPRRRSNARHTELALLLVAAAVVPGMNDPVTAATWPLAERRCASAPPATRRRRPSVLAVAAFTSVLTNEPAEVGADLATRALVAGGSGCVRHSRARLDGRPWFSFAAGSRRRHSRSSGPSAMTRFDRCWTSRSPRRGRPATAAGSRSAWHIAAGSHSASAISAPPRRTPGRRSLRLSCLRRRHVPGTERRACSSRLSSIRGELAAAEEALAPLDSEAEGGSLVGGSLRFSRGRLRVAQGRAADGLGDFLAVGSLLTRHCVTCPGYLPWRSEAALAHLALGDHESAHASPRRSSSSPARSAPLVRWAWRSRRRRRRRR